MAVDPTAEPSLMEAAAAANCIPTATACPDSPTRQNSTINFPKLPSPTSLVPFVPGPIPDKKDDNDDDDDDDDDEDDKDDHDDDDDVSNKPGIPEKIPPMPTKVPGQHVMPDDHYLETVTMTTTVCVPTVITSVITHKKPGPTPRPVQIPNPDKVYMPKPTASAFKPDKFAPRFTGAASVAELSSSLVFLVGAVVYLSFA
ncbi:hypothetical protein EPUL_001761 [Erysiphe pulchra]|uniref:Uncharacterized protein n=1 Tax=Erysiphe pulchra TaxID=225359 RepID=A0A2S4PUJ6_9PEZI|nr:hypothetical protein EPUL_001761 [Erysiphe pulchra]